MKTYAIITTEKKGVMKAELYAARRPPEQVLTSSSWPDTISMTG